MELPEIKPSIQSYLTFNQILNQADTDRDHEFYMAMLRRVAGVSGIEAVALRYNLPIPQYLMQRNYGWVKKIFTQNLGTITVADFLRIANTDEALKSIISGLSPETRSWFGFFVPICGGDPHDTNALTPGFYSYLMFKELFSDDRDPNHEYMRAFVTAMITPQRLGNITVRPIEPILSLMLLSGPKTTLGYNYGLVNDVFTKTLGDRTVVEFIRTASTDYVLTAAINSLDPDVKEYLGFAVITPTEATPTPSPPRPPSPSSPGIPTPYPQLTIPLPTIAIPPPTVPRPTIAIPPPTVRRPQ